MNPIKINNKWYIEIFTKEFGNILLLKPGKLEALKFSTKKEALDYIKNKEGGGA